MLTVTDDAVRHLAELLYDADAVDYNSAIRFVHEEGMIVPTLDHERPGDATYEYAGCTVLLLDEDIAAELGDGTLDVQDTDDGPRLTLLYC